MSVVCDPAMFLLYDSRTQRKLIEACMLWALMVVWERRVKSTGGCRSADFMRDGHGTMTCKKPLADHRAPSDPHQRRQYEV